MARMKTRSIPVRLSKPTILKADRAARRLGIARSALLKLGLAIVLPQIESGTITVPIHEEQEAA